MGFPSVESYFAGGYPRGGRFGLPEIGRQDVALEGLKLIRFSAVVRAETRDLDATVHFFEDDARFDEVWKDPDAYIGELGQYRQVLSPDFSLYTSTPPVLQMLNVFRSRWCGWYWQQHGLTVIPTVSWSTPWSFEFCFDGLPSDAVVAVSTVGARGAEAAFMAGYAHMCRRLTPTQVVCYGEPFASMAGLARLVIVPYSRIGRVSRREE